MPETVAIPPDGAASDVVADVLDRVDQFAEFDPRQHYQLTLASGELTEMERNAAATHPDDISLEL